MVRAGIVIEDFVFDMFQNSVAQSSEQAPFALRSWVRFPLCPLV